MPLPRVVADPSDHQDVRAGARGGNRLVGALAARELPVTDGEHGLARLGPLLDQGDLVDIDGPDHDDSPHCSAPRHIALHGVDPQSAVCGGVDVESDIDDHIGLAMRVVGQVS